ncbi:hypothetical protein EI94DRAFT_641038 [Lactarius quietus]|nr:hypothetical protein EI94DRAFT_641038 [Lactarius quietus]
MAISFCEKHIGMGGRNVPYVCTHTRSFPSRSFHHIGFQKPDHLQTARKPPTHRLLPMPRVAPMLTTFSLPHHLWFTLVACSHFKISGLVSVPALLANACAHCPPSCLWPYHSLPLCIVASFWPAYLPPFPAFPRFVSRLGSPTIGALSESCPPPPHRHFLLPPPFCTLLHLSTLCSHSFCHACFHTLVSF